MNNSIDDQAGHSYKEFLTSLAGTKEYCRLCMNFSWSHRLLRTPDLEPESLAGSRKEVVSSVIGNRGFLLRRYRDQIKRWGEFGILIQPNEQQGRLLVYEPGSNLADGAARNETFGFFDDNNAPPWDTWVANIVENENHNYLVCWIPEPYVNLTQTGIDVNPERCIYWLDKSSNVLAKLISQDKENFRDI